MTRHLSTLLFVVAALINLAPAVGVFSPERMVALYGVPLGDPNLEILMRHRAALFGIVGGFMLMASFHRPFRAIAYAMGFVSMVSYLLVAWVVGDYSEQIERVGGVDVVGLVALAGSWLAQSLDGRSVDDSQTR